MKPKHEQMWLRYYKDTENTQKGYFRNIYRTWRTVRTDHAVEELCDAAEQMFGILPNVINGEAVEEGIVLSYQPVLALPEGSYRIREHGGIVTIAASDDIGLLYGAYEVIRKVRCDQSLSGMDQKFVPRNRFRMLNHWDNIDGSIERGYCGNSYFFEKDAIIINRRTRDYARLLASVGINATVINNVNVIGKAVDLITDEYLGTLATMADIFREYGIRLYLTASFAAPILVGRMETADPLDENVIHWWKRTIDRIYQYIPDFGGFLIKADSEGQPGPFDYNRTHADGANMLGDLLAPYNGIVVWRCFVYVLQDWRDEHTDRAKMAYENFMPVDGQFHDNVILQIKNGPVDFQAHEPVSPLFGGLKNTNMMLEVQIAQEYTGQQIDVCYLVPMWREVLQFHTGIDSDKDTVAEIVSGQTYGNRNCGMAGIPNTGNVENWTGNDLAAANFYGFGRLAFDPDLTSEEIAREWICQNLGKAPQVIQTVTDILMKSWPTFEDYTSPLGTGWMMDERTHYEPVIEEQEYGTHGTYHRADHLAIGTDRSKKGTGYVCQYPEPIASYYDNIDTCPENLLLFFHRVPYSHIMKNGKTLLQYIYDSHFEGVETVKRMMASWDDLKEYVDPKIHERVHGKFEKQLYMAELWRDSVNTYFYRKTMIDDEQGRKIYR